MRKITLKVHQLSMIPHFIVPVILLSILFASCSSKNGGEKSDLLIGIAEVNYTPKVGFDLEGNYRGNDYSSRGIHDSLYARAIVAKDSKGEKAALLPIDICFLKKGPVEYMRRYVASNTDIRPANIMISVNYPV